MPDPIKLSEQNRAKLDGIVQQMVSNKEPDENIKFVVEDFKNKYAEKKKESSVSTATTATPNTVSDGGTTSLDISKSKGFPKIDTNSIAPNFDEMKPAKPVKAVKTPKPRGFASEVFYKLATGSAQLGADIAAVPELVYETFSMPQNAIADYFDLPQLHTDSDKFKKTIGVKNAVKDYYKQEVAKLKEESAKVDEKYKYGVYDSFKNGNYKDGFSQLTNSFAESLPATASIMLGGAYAKTPQLLAASTMMFGAGKNEELKDSDPDMTTNARVVNALGTGLAEGAFETIGSGSIGAAAKGIIEREGTKKAVTILKDGLVNFYKESLKKNPLITSIGGEGIEEWATQVTQNAIDVATGAKPQDYNVFTGGSDAFIGGVFGGAVFGGGLKGLEKVANYQDKTTIKSNTKKVFELQKALENPDISETTQAEIHKSIDGLVKTNQELVQKNIDHAENLHPKVKEKLVESDAKIDDIKSKVKEIKLDNSITDSQKEILLEGLKNDFSAATRQKNDILEGKTTAVDVLPLKEQDKLKREALKELTAEQNPDGSKNITIDDQQITERANKNYLKQQENESNQDTSIAETGTQTEIQKPQAEEEKTDQEDLNAPVEDVVATSVEKNKKNFYSQEEIDAHNDKYDKQYDEIYTRLEKEYLAKGIPKADIFEKINSSKELIQNSKERSKLEDHNNEIYKNILKDVVDNKLEIPKYFESSNRQKQLENSIRKRLKGKNIDNPNYDAVKNSQDLLTSENLENIKKELVKDFLSDGLVFEDLDSTQKQQAMEAINPIVKSFANLLSDDIINKQGFNEATPPTNTPADGNLQPGASDVGEVRVTEPESPAKESVPSSIDGGEVKGDAEISEFSKFEKVVNESKSVDEAFDKIKNIKGVSSETSKSFRNKYDPKGELSIKETFKKFYDEVKQGSKSEKTNESIDLANIKQVSNPTKGDLVDFGEGLEKVIDVVKTRDGKEFIKSTLADGSFDRENLYPLSEWEDTVSKQEEFYKRREENRKSQEERYAQQKLKEEKQIEKQKEFEDIDGFAEDKTRIQKGKILQHLNKQVYGGAIKSELRRIANLPYRFTEIDGKKRIIYTEENGTEFLLSDIYTTKTGLEYFQFLLDNKKQPITKATGKQIEPHKEVNTDVETVKKELNLSEVDNLLYDELKDTPEDKVFDKIDKIKDDKLGEIETIESKINDIDIKIEDNGDAIDKIDEDETLSAAKKKKAIAVLEKEFEDLQKQQKDLESQKEGIEKLITDIDDALFHPTEDYNVDKVAEVIRRVNNRLETRKSIKEGTNLFPEDANIPELKTPKKETQKPTTKEKIAERIKLSDAKVDDWKNAVKDIDSIFGIKIKVDDIDGLNKNGIDIVEVIANIAKQAIAAGIHIDEAINKTIEHLKKTIDFEVDIDAVKERINPKEEKETVQPESNIDLEAFRDSWNKEPSSGEINQYDSGNTILREHGELRNNQNYEIQKDLARVQIGIRALEHAKVLFGPQYVEKTLSFIEQANLSPEKKAVAYVLLENEMDARVKEFPDNVGVKKLQDLVRSKSQAFLANSARAIGAGRFRVERFRELAKNGFSEEEFTNAILTTQQIKNKAKIQQLSQVSPDDINNEADTQEGDEDFTIEEPKKKRTKSAVKKDISAVLAQMRKDLLKVAKGNAAMSSIPYAAQLQAVAPHIIKLSKLLAELGGMTTREIINEVYNDIKEVFPEINKNDVSDILKEEARKKTKPKTESDKKEDSAREVVKKALIEKGFGREITVNKNQRDVDGNLVKDENGRNIKIKEKRIVLDWKKLAGEAGTIDNIRKNVEESLKGSNYSKAQIEDMKEALEKEYVRLTADIIEKGLNELQNRNAERKLVNTKSAAKKLAELYNYGLFEKSKDSYEKIINSVLGFNELDQRAWNDMKQISEGYKTLLNSGFSEIATKDAINSLSRRQSRLVATFAFSQADWKFKLAVALSEITNLSTRFKLVNLGNLTENISSGMMARAANDMMDAIANGISGKKTSNKALQAQSKINAKAKLKGITFEASESYGDTSSLLLNHSAVEDYFNNATTNKMYHALISTYMAKPVLEGADSYNKILITEAKMVRATIKVLEAKGMKNSEALDYVAKALTGESMQEALVKAKALIEKVNTDAGKKLLNDSEASVKSLAADIVKESLVSGGQISEAELKAIYNAAYKSAGKDIGHVSNNWVTDKISSKGAQIEKKVADAIKEKNWSVASGSVINQIIWKNFISTFVGGGTNWFVKGLQKTANPLSLISLRDDRMQLKMAGKLDVTTDEGIKNMEEVLYRGMNLRSTSATMLMGAIITSAIIGSIAATGADDDIDKWLKQNPWAKKFFDKLVPDAVVLMLAIKNKDYGRYIAKTINVKADFFDDQKNIKDILEKYAKGYDGNDQVKMSKASGDLGAMLGKRFELPGPLRAAKDVKQIYKGVFKGEYNETNYYTSGFLNGFFQGGIVEGLGLRKDPDFQEKPKNKKKFNEDKDRGASIENKMESRMNR